MVELSSEIGEKLNHARALRLCLAVVGIKADNPYRLGDYCRCSGDCAAGIAASYYQNPCWA
jgi:hypothetical protein